MPDPTPLPSQPDDVPWPTQAWPEEALAGGPARALAAPAEAIASDADTHGEHLALLVSGRSSPEQRERVETRIGEMLDAFPRLGHGGAS